MTNEVYDLEFLKGKGFFQSKIDMEDEVSDDKKIKYFYDSDHNLAYFDYQTDNEIRKILKSIKNIRNYEYYWFWKDERLCVHRVFGENKWFIYNIPYRKFEYKKSKQDKLKRFEPKNTEILFDVKDVIDTFYKNLWNIRIKLARSVKDDVSDQEKILVAQRIIDRLIFIYFISQKGILKVVDDMGREIEFDIKKLFKYIVESFETDSKGFFRFINKLFFEYLNSEKNEHLKIEGIKGYSIKVPFLNGGLFRECEINNSSGYKLKESDIDMRYNWKELIDELKKYNWILGDYLPTEKGYIVGNLTPEILGHIYEKFVITISGLDEIKISELKITKEGDLRSGRRKIGGYYTPKEITEYISENTIWPYIRDDVKLENRYEKFEDFWAENKQNTVILNELNKELSNIKILDPAVGSGAFLMAAGDLLVEWRRKCGEKKDDYSLKKEIITDNLFGVDIMAGAIEICKLRLWLWLISSARTDKVDPLPNIEYNYRCGNSLIGWINENISPVIDEMYTSSLENEFKALLKVVSKKEIKKVEEARNLLKKYGLDKYIKSYTELYEIYKNATDERSYRIREILENIRNKMYEWIDQAHLNFINEKITRNKKIKFEEYKELNPFHWGVDFDFIFKNGGFDTIIGNPPYGNILKNFEKDIISWTYPYKTIITDNKGKGSNNSASIFIERSILFLKDKGNLSLIVPNSIPRIPQFSKIRRTLIDNYYIYHMMDAGFPFIGVNLEMVIFFIKNEKRKEYEIHCKSFKIPGLWKTPKYIFKKFDYIPIYFDDIFKNITNLSKVRYDMIKATQGRPRRADYVHEGIRCISSKVIDPYHLKLDKDADRIVPFNFNYIDDEYHNEYLITPYFFGTSLESITKDVLEAIIKPVGVISDGNSILLMSEKKYLKYLCCILNSEFINHVLKQYILNFSIRDITIRNDTFKKLPIPIPVSVEVFARLTEYLIFLNQHHYDNFKKYNLINEDIKIQIEFYEDLVNYLVYELYFKKEISSNLIDKLKNKLSSIPFEEWFKCVYAFKGDKHMKDIRINDKIQVKISDTYNRLKNDREINSEIRTIKECKMVKKLRWWYNEIRKSVQTISTMG